MPRLAELDLALDRAAAPATCARRAIGAAVAALASPSRRRVVAERPDRRPPRHRRGLDRAAAPASRERRVAEPEERLIDFAAEAGARALAEAGADAADSTWSSSRPSATTS